MNIRTELPRALQVQTTSIMLIPPTNAVAMKTAVAYDADEESYAVGDIVKYLGQCYVCTVLGTTSAGLFPTHGSGSVGLGQPSDLFFMACPLVINTVTITMRDDGATGTELTITRGGPALANSGIILTAAGGSFSEGNGIIKPSEAGYYGKADTGYVDVSISYG